MSKAQDKANADYRVGRGPINCTYIIRAQGGPYPRTCERCRLGPCPFYQDERAMTDPPTDDVEVTQADMDAAAAVWECWVDMDVLADAFAKHRQAALRAQPSRDAYDEEQERFIFDWFNERDTDGMTECLAMFRALKESL